VVEYLKKECKYTDEVIKEKERWLEEHLDYIRKYGMCPVHVQFLEPYEDFVKIFGKPPAILGDKEPEWKFAIILMMREEYGARAEWTLEMAFREFLQNALDGAEEIGHSTKEVKIKYEDGLLYVENPSKKLLVKHLELGGSEKPCWSRGRYGEGLNVASSWIVNTGGTVYIFTHDVAYRIIEVEGRLAILVADIPYIGNVTRVVIHHKDASKMEGLVSKLMPDFNTVIYEVKLPYTDCPHYMPNRILEKSEQMGKIYHRDMLVNYAKTAYGKDSLFDYDLWWFTVSRDRANIADMWKFRMNLENVYMELTAELKKKLDSHNWEHLVPEIEGTKEYQLLRRIIDECLVAVPTSEGTFFMYTGDYLEHDILKGSIEDVKRVFTYVLKDKIAKTVGKAKLSKVGFAVGVSAPRIRDYLYMGYVPIVFQVDPAITTLPSIDELISEEYRDISHTIEDIRVPLADYTRVWNDWFMKYGAYAIYLANKVKNYSYVILMSEHSGGIIRKDLFKRHIFFVEFCKTKLKDEEETDRRTIGFYDPKADAVYYGIDRLTFKACDQWGCDSDTMFDLAFEEIVHYETGYSDNTARFEKALIEHARKFARELMDLSRMQMYYLMAENGLFHDVAVQSDGIIKLLKVPRQALLVGKEIAEFVEKLIDTSKHMVVYSVYEDYATPVLEIHSSIDIYELMTPDVVIRHIHTLSPIALIGNVDEKLSMVFIEPDDSKDSRIIQAYIGYLVTGREDYFKELIKCINELVGKIDELGEEYYIALIPGDEVIIFDNKGREVGKL